MSIVGMVLSFLIPVIAAIIAGIHTVVFMEDKRFPEKITRVFCE
jgi:hypothetical protein